MMRTMIAIPAMEQMFSWTVKCLCDLRPVGSRTPTVSSQAALHRMPTRALSLPPELPKTTPEACALSTSERIQSTRFSNSFSKSLMLP